VGGVLSLPAGVGAVIAFGITGRGDHAIGRAQEHVVFGEVTDVIDAATVVGGAAAHGALMPGTAGELRPGVVDDAVVVVNEGAIQRGVIQFEPAVPTANVDQRAPQMIRRDAARHLP